jgi:hypothetical protein
VRGTPAVSTVVDSFFVRFESAPQRKLESKDLQIDHFK